MEMMSDFVSFLEMRGCRPRTVKFYLDYLRSFFKITNTDFSIFGNPVKLEESYLIIHQREITSSTKRKYLIAISIFSDFLLKKKILEVNHARELPLPKVQKRLPIGLSVDEVGQIRAYVDSLWGGYVRDRNMMIIDCFIYTGLRRGELAQLQKRDVFYDRIVVREGKGGKDRIVFLPDAFGKRLIEYIDAQNLASRDLLFHNVSGGPLKDRTFHTIFYGISRKMGKHIYPHLLRHTYASICVQSGIDIYTLQKQMGHSNISTTSVYLYMNDYERHRVMQKMI